jgi:hypothetical protein
MASTTDIDRSKEINNQPGGKGSDAGTKKVMGAKFSGKGNPTKGGGVNRKPQSR